MKNSVIILYSDHKRGNSIKLPKSIGCFLFCTIVAIYTFSMETSAKPAQITDLSASNDFQLKLIWTAPSNGNGLPCSSYFVKYSTSGDITNDVEFIRSNTYYHVWAPLAVGSKETKILDGLLENTTYWFSIRSNSGAEWSEISSTGTNFAVAGPRKSVGVQAYAKAEHKPLKTEDKIALAYTEAVACFKKKEYILAYEKFTAIVDTSSAPGEKYVKASKKHTRQIMSDILKIIKKGKEGKDMNYAAGFLLYLDKRYDESLVEFLEFLKAEPGNKEVAGYAEIIDGRIKEEKKQEINAYLAKAKELVYRRKYDDAIKELQQLLIISPGHLQASNLEKEIRLEIEKRKKNIEEQKMIPQNETVVIERAAENADAAVIDAAGRKGIIVGTSTAVEQHNIDLAQSEEYYKTAMKKYEEGYLKKAIENLEEALIHNPGDARIKEFLIKIRREYEYEKNIAE